MLMTSSETCVGSGKPLVPPSVQFDGDGFFALLTRLDAWANASPHPHLDVLGLGTAFGVMAMLLSPYLDRIQIGTKSLNLRFKQVVETATESTAELDKASDLLDARSDLSQGWFSQVNWLNRHLQLATTSDEDAVNAVLRFCRERIADARNALGEEDEGMRISVWWYSESREGLVFLLSENIRDINTRNYCISPRLRVAWAGFCAENRVWNVPDATAEVGYVKIRQEAPPYKGLLCVPISFGRHDPIGMISVDRSHAEKCYEDDVRLVDSLADLIAYALTTPRITQRYGVLPDRVVDALSGGSLTADRSPTMGRCYSQLGRPSIKYKKRFGINRRMLN